MIFIAPLPNSYNNLIIDVIDCGVEKIHSFIDKISSVVNSTEFSIGTSSLDCISKATSIAYFTHVEITKQLAAFEQSSEFPDFVKTLQKTATVALEFITKWLGVVSTVISVYSVTCLYDKTMANIKERREANASGDWNRILRANFNAVALTTDYLKVPAVILSALVLCGVAIPAIILTATAVIAAVGAYFAAAHVFVSYSQHNDTLDLLNELKLSRHRIFLDEYYTALIKESEDDEKKAELSQLRNGVHVLSLAETTSAKKEIKRSIEESDEKRAVYDNSLKSANQHFINLLSAKIALDSKIIEEHFRVSLPKTDDEDVELSTCNRGEWEEQKAPNFFEKLSSHNFQSDEQKLQKAVKCLKIRLEDKLLSDESEMILGSFALVATTLGVVSAAGIAIAPIVATVGLILGVPKVALMLEEHYFRKPEFIAAMEKLTATAPDLEEEDDEDSIGDNLPVRPVQYVDSTVDYTAGR